jgi:hypothetical protein
VMVLPVRCFRSKCFNIGLQRQELTNLRLEIFEEIVEKTIPDTVLTQVSLMADLKMVEGMSHSHVFDFNCST